MKSNFPFFFFFWSFMLLVSFLRLAGILKFYPLIKKITPQMKMCYYQLLHSLFQELLVVGPKEEISSLIS